MVKSKWISHRVLGKREKNMYRLMSRYVQRITEPNSWVLPYVWDVYYLQLPGEERLKADFICYTNNAAFAAMLFEAQILPLKVQIVRIEIAGLEENFHKIVSNG